MKTKLIFAIVGACGVAVLIAQQRPAGPYTQSQVAEGRSTYETNCVSCHAADLSGREGPQLAGANFMAQWGDRSAGDLIKYIQSTMPPGAAALPGDSYQNLAAFLLDANGARLMRRPNTHSSIHGRYPQHLLRPASCIFAGGGRANQARRFETS